MKNIILKNYLYLLFTQLITLGINILMSVIFPKILNMESFGYWQIFLFYSSFVGFFHFGLNDGIYLRYGGKNILIINNELLRAQFFLLLALQIIVFCALLLIQNFWGRQSLHSIVLYVLVFMIINNLSSYLTSFLQAVNKIVIFSNSTIITNVSFLMLCFILYVSNNLVLDNIILIYVLSNFFGLIYILIKAKSILFNKILFKVKNLDKYFSEFKINLLVGFFLMISTISGMLILGVGRFLIEKKWGVVTFGIVSLSFTIATFLLFFIRQIGIVIFPILKGINLELQKKYFSLSNNFLNFFLLGILLFFPLISYLISYWLPNFNKSIEYFIYIIPMIIYEGKMQILLNTYMKALRKEKLLMFINIFSFLTSTVLCIIGYYYNNLSFIVISMTLATILRGVILEFFLGNKLGSLNANVIFEVLILLILFIVSFSNFDIKTAFVTYLISFVIFIFLNRMKLREIKNEIKEHY